MFQIISHILHFIRKISYIIPKAEWSEQIGLSSLGIMGGSHMLGDPPTLRISPVVKRVSSQESWNTNPCIQCIMFRRHLDFFWKKGDFLSSATFSGVQVVWGRYNFTRIHVSNRYLGPLAVSGMTIQVPYRIPF